MATLPPFAPPRRHNDRPPSPSFPLQQILSGAAMSPVGCELIVQGITPKGGLTAADLVRNSINNATTTTTNLTVSVKDKELHKITVMPSNGSVRPERDAFCYIRLAAVVTEHH